MDSEHEEIEEDPPRRKRLYTYNRCVNSIDSSLDEENYDPVAIPEARKVILGNIRNEEEIRFVNQPPATVGRQRMCDVIRSRPGVTALASNAKTPKDAFDLFITPNMIEDLVTLTNNRIKKTLEQLPQNVAESNKYPSYREIDSQDLYAFIGLFYYRGLYKVNTHYLDILFSEEQGLPMFGATMSHQRFKFILAHLCFDDAETRPERWKRDRFAALREFFELCNDRFARMLIPEDYLTIDETLYPIRTQIAFRQYNPDKPAKYGLLFKSINCARYPYTYQAHIYAGKPEGDPNEFYVSGTDNYIKFLVNKLLEHQPLQGRNISMDRLYTSIPIARWLLEKGITMIGTLKANRVGIPPAIKDISQRDINSWEMYWDDSGNMNISSYVVKTSSGKKNILMLSTVRPLMGVTKDDGKHKPALYKLYDFTKGGTDIIDQKVGAYTVKPKSRRWSVAAFSFILDTVRVNASSVVALNNNENLDKVNAFQFGYELIKALVLPSIQRRPKNGLTTSVLRKISLVTGEEIDRQPQRHNQGLNHPPISKEAKQCKVCYAGTKGKDQKEKKDRMKCIQSVCQRCGIQHCRDHLIQVCDECQEKIIAAAKRAAAETDQ